MLMMLTSLWNKLDSSNSLLFGGFQLHIAISKTSARVVIDCKMVAEKSIKAAGNISTEGVEVLGRMVRSRGNKDNSAPVRMAVENS